MLAAIVNSAGLTPRYGEFDEPEVGPGETLINVTASALSPLARGRASGAHYSSGNHFPFVPGVDGTGRLADGRRVYFLLPRAPFGSFAERTVVRNDQWFELPDDIDDVRAALIANPGMSSWAALTERTRLKLGDTVLVNGATGAAGQLAVRIARHLGAAKVIATGRNADTLERVGADETIVLGNDSDRLERELMKQFASGIDIVLDYLWGSSAHSILLAAAKAGADGVPIHFVQIGSVSGAEISLPAAVLRSTAITLMGSGLGSVGLDRLMSAIRGVIEAVVPIGLALDHDEVPLTNIGMAWSNAENSNRVVFKVD